MRQLPLRSMSSDELFALHSEIVAVLTRRMLEEKKRLEQRLAALGPATPSAKGRRPYPPVRPKFADPDYPARVWSGRGKRPTWISEKLAEGVPLDALRVNANPKAY